MMKFVSKITIAFAAIILISSCSSSVRFSSNESSSTSPKTKSISSSKTKKSTDIEKPANLNSIQKNLLSEAEKWLGVPYAWGGNTKKGVDCSGFVKEVYEKVGIMLPRTAALQFEYADRINKNERRIGDLVFFKKSGQISHVGIYIGNNQIIHSSSGKGVIKQSLDDDRLQELYAGMGRVLQ